MSGQSPGGAAARGLTSTQAAEALATWGPNRLPEVRRSPFRLLRRQFEDVLVYILLAALAISVAMPFAEGERWASSASSTRSSSGRSSSSTPPWAWLRRRKQNGRSLSFSD